MKQNAGLHAVMDRIRTLAPTAPDERPPGRDDRFCRCGTCDGYAHVFADDGTACQCPHYKRERERRRLNGILEDFEDWPAPGFVEIKRHPQFQMTPCFAQAQLLCQDLLAGKDPRAVLACGEHGRGKTLSGLCLIRDAAMAGKRVHAVHFPRLVQEKKRGLDGQGFIEWTFDEIRRADFVLLDEYGRADSSGNQDHAHYLFNEIVRRLFRQRFALITSNLAPVELKAYMDSYAFSRVSKNGGYGSTLDENTPQDLRGTRLVQSRSRTCPPDVPRTSGECPPSVPRVSGATAKKERN